MNRTELKSHMDLFSLLLGSFDLRLIPTPSLELHSYKECRTCLSLGSLKYRVWGKSWVI